MSQAELTFEPDVYSVSQITQKIKKVLESRFGRVLIEGETSNVKKARSGHIYFTLKDDDAQIPCVIWRSIARRQNVALTDGQQIMASGDVEVYAPHGRYQLIVKTVKQAGVGALQLAFEKLKKKLEEEGLFKEIHKKKLPKFPRTIGVITSATGAAFQDIRSTLKKRYPLVTVLLHHASVQGVQAAPELVKALSYFEKRDDVDLLIVGRGGGSLEDLWPFNEEAVARAIFKCGIPIISAVGHEVDFSISDFVADARAATPTHAAVVATPDINELRFYIDDLSGSMESLLEHKITRLKDKLNMLKRSYAFGKFDEQLARVKEQVDRKREQLQYLIKQNVQRKQEAFTQWHHRLEKVNPNAPLEAGFSRIYRGDDWIKTATDFDKSANTAITIEWMDGKRKRTLKED